MLPDSFSAARSLGDQIMTFNSSALSGQSRLEISIPRNSTREIEIGSPAPTNFITITPPSSSIVGVPIDGKVVDEQLRGIGLTLAAMPDLLAMYSSSFGKNRAQNLETIIFWQVGIPVPRKNEIMQVDMWIPACSEAITETLKVQQLLKRSLAIEMSSTELRIMHGDDWYQHLAVIIANFPQHDAIKQLNSQTRDICDRFSSTINSTCQQLMTIVMEYKMQELRERTILQMKEKEQILKKKLASLVTQQHAIVALVEQNEARKQEMFISHGSNAIGNSPESIVHAFQHQSTQATSPATPQRASRGLFSAIVNFFQSNQNDGVSGSGSPVQNQRNTSTSGATTEQNYNNNNSTRTSLMEQIRLHQQHQGQQSSLGPKTYFQR